LTLNAIEDRQRVKGTNQVYGVSLRAQQESQFCIDLYQKTRPQSGAAISYRQSPFADMGFSFADLVLTVCRFEIFDLISEILVLRFGFLIAGFEIVSIYVRHLRRLFLRLLSKTKTKTAS
jgi:hypothetical protein